MKKEQLNLDELKNQIEVLSQKQMASIFGGDSDAIDINDPSKPMFGGTIGATEAVQALDANPYA